MIPVVSQEDSNGSSLGEKESSSSFDEYSAGNTTTSSSYTKEEPEQLIETCEINPILTNESNPKMEIIGKTIE